MPVRSRRQASEVATGTSKVVLAHLRHRVAMSPCCITFHGRRVTPQKHSTGFRRDVAESRTLVKLRGTLKHQLSSCQAKEQRHVRAAKA